MKLCDIAEQIQDIWTRILSEMAGISYEQAMMTLSELEWNLRSALEHFGINPEASKLIS